MIQGYETFLFRARGYNLFLLRARRHATFLCPLSSRREVLDFSHSRQRVHGFWVLGPKGTRPTDLAYLWEGFQAKGYRIVRANSKRYATFWRLHVWKCGCSGYLLLPSIKAHIFRPGLGQLVLGDCDWSGISVERLSGQRVQDFLCIFQRVHDFYAVAVSGSVAPQSLSCCPQSKPHILRSRLRLCVPGDCS